jgi:hypothetical protein
MLEQVPVRVDGVPQVVHRNRAPDRVAVDVDDQRRGGAVEDGRWIGLDAVVVLGPDAAGVDIGEHEVEGQDALAKRQARLEGRDDGRRFLFRRADKIRREDSEAGEVHQPLGDRHARVCLGEDGAESRHGLAARVYATAACNVSRF